MKKKTICTVNSLIPRKCRKGRWRGGGGPRTFSYGGLEILSTRPLKYLPIPQVCYILVHGELMFPKTNTRVILYTLVPEVECSPERCRLQCCIIMFILFFTVFTQQAGNQWYTIRKAFEPIEKHCSCELA